MNLKHFLSGCCCAALLLGLPVSAYTQDLDQNEKFLQPRAEVSVKGGTDRSLLTTEFWAPLAQERDRVLYGDIRLMGDNDENREGNLGVGYRQVVEDYVLGGHAWIDRRRTTNNSTFHQATFGVERLGHIVDIRANGYIPLNNSHSITTPNLGTSTPYLAGSGIFYDTNGILTETPQYGADAEIGYRFPIFPKQIDTFRVYGGGYHFFRKDTENVTGFRIRTEAQINKAISIGARFQHDGPRGSQGFLEATLKFPFSAKKLYHEDYIRSRLDESPERDVDIVTDAKRDTGMMKPIINTASGAQQRVLYVDNTNTQTGDGTKENPFNNLKAAEAALQANDILYVNHGDGTTTGMDKGLVIDKANVSLIGSGSNFVYDAGKFSAQNGANFNGILLAAAGNAPIITNTLPSIDVYTGNAIDAKSDNVFISGITVSGANRNGIFVNAMGADQQWSNVTITNVTSQNNLSHGIYVTANEGRIDNINLSHITSTANDGRGLQVQAVNGDAYINTVNLLNNTISGNTVGIYVIASAQGIINNVNIKDNISSNNIGVNAHGIWVNSLSATSKINQAIISGNTLNNNAQNGVYIYAATGSTLENISIMNNTISQNSNYGIYTLTNGNSLLNTLNISDNTLTSNVSHGIYTQASTGKMNNATINHNTISGSNYGIYANTASNALMENLFITNNTSSSNVNGIVNFAATTSKINNSTISGNTTDNNSLYGIYLTANNAEITTSHLSNNIANANTQYGVFLYSQNAGAILNNISISGSDMIGNGIYGIYANKNHATAILNLDMGGGAYGSTGQNRMTGNTTNDVRLNYLGGGSATARNNYWGGGALTRVQLSASTTIDSTAFLTVNPRP